jgi:putative ATPase
MNEVLADVRAGRAWPVPMHLRNAPTRAMKEWGYSKGYEHAHNFEEAVPDMECLPDEIAGRRYYEPTGRGIEKRIGERLAEIESIRRQRRGTSE